MSRLLTFGIGVLAGIVAALGGLEVWGNHLGSTIYENAQPVVLRPLAANAASSSATSLPQLRFPGAPSATHDNWMVESLSGNRLRLRDLKGKAVFLNFWNTGCVPCIEEMPSIERLRKSLGNENVAFLVVTPEKRDAVEKFTSQARLSVPVFLASEDPPADLGIQGFPTTYILNASGSVVYEHAGAANWDTDDARRFIREEAGERRNP